MLMMPDTGRARTFFILYLCAILHLSLYPWEFLLHPKLSGLQWTPLTTRRPLMDAALNVLLYIPLGAAGLLSVRRRWVGWSIALTAGCSLSGAIEWVQLWSTQRYGTYTDLLANSAGTLAGATAAHLAARWGWFERWNDPKRDSRWRIRPGTEPLFGFWMLWQMFPFIPWISLPRLTGLANLTAPWSWLTMAECLAGFALLRLAMGRTYWLWAAFAALPAQAMLIDRALSPAALAGAALGWVLAERGLWEKIRPEVWLPAWLVFEELRPFRLAPKHAFAWIPFSTWYEASSGNYYAVVFGKLFLYTAVVWSLRRQGSGWMKAVGIPALIAAIGEWAQQYLAGRTPESTEVLLVLAAAVLLAMFEERHS